MGLIPNWMDSGESGGGEEPEVYELVSIQVRVVMAVQNNNSL